MSDQTGRFCMLVNMTGIYTSDHYPSLSYTDIGQARRLGELGRMDIVQVLGGITATVAGICGLIHALKKKKFTVAFKLEVSVDSPTLLPKDKPSNE